MNKKIHYPLALIMLFSLNLAKAQHTNFNTQRNWSLNKKEIMFGLGATQFLGDLGGRDQIGKGYSLRDIDWGSTNIGGMVGFRYRFHPYFATSTTLNVGMVRGNDALTNEIIRNSRNLHFRSLIVELSQRLEFILWANEKFGARYKVKGLKHARDKNDQIYVFGGVGATYYNPKAMYQGKWTALRPLKTEGQGLTDGAKPYGPITLSIPMGVGFRMGINRMWRIGIEAIYVKTFSDYIDDVSGTYYDPNVLASEVSTTSAYLSNPSYENPVWFSAGEQRGDKGEKDAYFYLNVVVYRNITYKDYAGQRKQATWRGGRYKF
jgi:hypothetical protein